MPLFDSVILLFQVWPFLLFVILFSGILSISLTRHMSTLPVVFLILLSVAMLGLVAGYMTGNSQTPVVGVVVPSVLTLFGAMAVYLFSVGPRAAKVLTAAAVLSLATNLLVGVFWGTKVRQDFAAYIESPEFKLKREIDAEILRQLRKKYGLPDQLSQ